MRKLVYALAAVVLIGSGLRADSISGKVKSVDADKSTITITVGGQDKTFSVDKSAKIFTLKGKKNNKQPQDVPGGLNGVEGGKSVTLTTETKSGKEVVTEVKVTKAKKKKK